MRCSRFFPIGFLLVFLTASATAENAKPLNALIVTSQGVYHNYRQQTWVLAHRLAEMVNVRFDVSLAETERWKTTDYSEGYDVLIYNFCMADKTEPALIANMRRQTEVLGVPALFIHCTMHSFRNTDNWWPMLGLKTRVHAPLQSLSQVQVIEHPILTGIPREWVLTHDELYLAESFDGAALITSVAEDGTKHVTAWLAYPGGTPTFGTTLGHSKETISNPPFQRLLANALLFVTGNLQADGTPAAGMEGDSESMDIFENFSAPDGVKFLGEEGKDCAFRKLVMAAGPCHIGCILNPFEWGEATDACKQSCQANLPSPDELIADCATGL